MDFSTNQKVKTPLGYGVAQGGFELRHGDDKVILPINETTSPYLKQSNCMTPKAQISGVWVFQEREVTA